MTKTLFLAVDIGTSSSKGTIADANGQVYAQHFLLHSGLSLYPGWHEHDAEKQWWGDFVSIVQDMFRQIPERTQDIACICVSGMWPTFCFADERGQPVRNAILYDDVRAAPILQEMLPKLGPNVFGYELVPKIEWLKLNEPEVWERVRLVLTTPSFIVYKLTGAYCIDPHTAWSFGNIFDEVEHKWNQSKLSEFGIKQYFLPAIFPPDAIAGYVTRSAAARTGLLAGTPVIVGTGDTFISILGSGASQEGDGVIYYGSLGMLLRLTHTSTYLISAPSYAGGDDGIDWLLSMTKSGKQLEWFVKILNPTLADDANIDFGDFDAQVMSSPPGASDLLFLHDLSWSRVPFVATTPHAGLLGLTVYNQRGDIYRAIVEAFGYAVRRSIEQSSAGRKTFKRLFAAGGGARSLAWRQIVTDITGLPQLFSEKSLGSFGGTLLAGHAMGLVDLNAAAVKEAAISHLTTPQPSNSSAYDITYKRYLSASSSLAGHIE